MGGGSSHILCCCEQWVKALIPYNPHTRSYMISNIADPVILVEIHVVPGASAKSELELAIVYACSAAHRVTTRTPALSLHMNR
eukprot:5556668-Pyramimonas_sp.AAC.1